MTSTESTTTLPEAMRQWIEAVVGEPVRAATRQAGGGRNEGWLIVLDDQRLFLRWDRSPAAANGDPWSVHREARIYQALTGRGLAVAALVGVHPTEQAMLLEAVAGDGRFSLVRDPQRATAIAQDFVQRLADIHRIDAHELGLVAAGTSIAEHVQAQLDEIAELIRVRGGVPEAELALALRWLGEHIPDHDGRVVLVQGDTGPGNFMFDGDRVSAIVDWELAHPGDPMDDLAWISLRSTQEPFPDLGERFREYELASGEVIDLDRIRYYRVLAEAKIAAMGHGVRRVPGAADASGGGDVGARLIFGQLHRRLLVECLCDVMGIDRVPADLLDTDDADTDDADTVDAADTADWHGLYAVVLGQLRDVITPRVDDGFALQRIKGLARIVKYLESADRHGRSFADDELDDLAELFGRRPGSVAEGRRQLAEAVHAGTLDADAALVVVSRRIARDNVLLREASGVLADRHYDPLTRFERSVS